MATQNSIRKRPRTRLTEKEANLFIGTQLRKARLLRGLTQGDVGDELGVSYQQIQRYEQGTVSISPGKLKTLARIVGVPITYFFGVGKSNDKDNALFGARLMLLMRRLPEIERRQPDLFMAIYKMVATPRKR